jgi:hypothetical protein
MLGCYFIGARILRASNRRVSCAGDSCYNRGAVLPGIIERSEPRWIQQLLTTPVVERSAETDVRRPSGPREVDLHAVPMRPIDRGAAIRTQGRCRTARVGAFRARQQRGAERRQLSAI